MPFPCENIHVSVTVVYGILVDECRVDGQINPCCHVTHMGDHYFIYFNVDDLFGGAVTQSEFDIYARSHGIYDYLNEPLVPNTFKIYDFSRHDNYVHDCHDELINILKNSTSLQDHELHVGQYLIVDTTGYHPPWVNNYINCS